MKLDLSELPVAPQQYKVAGVALLVFGIVLLLAGIVLVVLTQTQRTDQPSQTQMVAKECIERIKALGLKAVPENGHIRISEPNMSQTVELLAKSSQAISLCPDWNLTQYCLGSGCQPAGLTMVLQYNEPSTKK